MIRGGQAAKELLKSLGEHGGSIQKHLQATFAEWERQQGVDENGAGPPLPVITPRHSSHTGLMAVGGHETGWRALR